MSDRLEPFLCGSCKKLVKSDDKSIAEHYGSQLHDKGLYETQPPQQPQPQPHPQFPPRQFTPPGAYPTSETWPQADLPQRPPTRALSWTKQIQGMWYYYRLGMIYYTIAVMLLTIALLTRLQILRFFGKKPKFGVIKLQPVQDFKDHPHVVTTYQYPNRVYAVCPICGTYARLEWKDTGGRLWHRTFGALPQLIQVTLLFAGILFLVIVALLHA